MYKSLDDTKLQAKLQSLAWLPSHGEIDDTRFEKLLTNLTPHCKYPLIIRFLELDAVAFLKAGASHLDDRLRSVALRLFGELSSTFEQNRNIPHEDITIIEKWKPKILEELCHLLASGHKRLDQPPPREEEETLQAMQVRKFSYFTFLLIRTRQELEASDEDEDEDIFAPPATQKPKIVENGASSQTEQPHTPMAETALTVSATLVALQQWIRQLPALPAETSLAILRHVLRFIRAGFEEASQFVQADAVKIMVELSLLSLAHKTDRTSPQLSSSPSPGGEN